MAEISERLPTLPEDLIMEILFRLQNVKSVQNVKSIGRCRCLSKTWRSFLSGPQFAKSHLYGPENIFLISHYDDHPPHQPYVATFTTNSCVATEVNFPFELADWVQGSCHGLVLLFVSKGLLLLNPITQEAATIPPYKTPYSCSYGLGYDSHKDDFKVVSIEKRGIDIYNVKTRTWKTLPNPTSYSCLSTSIMATVFFKGCLHFMCRTRDHGPLVIAAFNVATEKFQSVVPYPKGFRSLRPCVDGFTVIGGCLAMVVASSGFSFHLWLMKEYGVQDSWTKFPVHPPVYGMNPLCFSGEDEIVLLRRFPTRFVRYNWRSGVWRDMAVDGALNNIQGSVISFRESLISPNYK